MIVFLLGDIYIYTLLGQHHDMDTLHDGFIICIYNMICGCIMIHWDPFVHTGIMLEK